MGLSVIDWEEVDDGQLTQFIAADLEDSFAAALPILATVEDDVRSDALGTKLLLIVTEKFDSLIVVESTLIVPSSRIDARECKVLIGLLTEEPEESHLNDADRFVRHL